MTHDIDCGTRPFPRPCPECGQIEVWPATIAHETDVKHDGSLYHLQIPCLGVTKCKKCDEVYFVTETHDQISQALRDELGLLSPREIRSYLNRFNWSQKEFAEHLGTTPETVSRWLSGSRIQSRVMDKCMRNLFELESLKRESAVAAGSPVVQGGVFTPKYPCEPT